MRPRDIANEMHVSQSTVRLWLSGKSAIPPLAAALVAAYKAQRVRMTAPAIAHAMSVTIRTVHGWLSGRVKVPAAAIAMVAQNKCSRTQIPRNVVATPCVRDIANEMHVSISTVRRWLSGKSAIPPLAAALVAAYKAQRVRSTEFAAPLKLRQNNVVEPRPRPKTRGECGAVRPCPWVGCRYHLLLEVGRDGSLRLTHPDIWDMPMSCSLDVADRGGETRDAIGELLGLDRESIRTTETRALDSVAWGLST